MEKNVIAMNLIKDVLQKEALAFILKNNKAGKNGRNLLADLTEDKKGCKQCWINMGDQGLIVKSY